MSVLLRERKGRVRKKGEYAGKSITKWYLEYNINGERWTETLPIKHIPNVTNLKEMRNAAKAIKVQKENEINTRGYDFIPKEIDKILFVEYFENFIANYTKADVRMFEGALRQFKEFLEAADENPNLITLKALNTDLCKRYADYLKNSNLTGETPHNYFQRFNRILKELTRIRYIRENPVDFLELNDKPKKKPNSSLEKEILRFADIQLLSHTECGNAQVKDAFLFACFTGLGLAEIKNLKWNNVKNGELKTYRQKTGQEVNFPLPQTAQNILAKYDRDTEYIFSLPSSTSVNKTLQNWVDKAELDKHITFYCARHSAAVMMLDDAGANLKAVADFLGHSDTTHTVRYLKHIDKSVKKAISKLPEI